jgi:hypothetical protein
MTLNEAADLLESSHVHCLSAGNYLNRRGVRGYYVQLKCGSNWCKVSVSNADRHSSRIIVLELDEICLNTRQPELIIPLSSISAALRSAAAEQAPINNYFNNRSVPGIWSEFFHNGNWYMVSVSHIALPTNATHAELEWITDEFLRQQDHTRRRHG